MSDREGPPEYERRAVAAWRAAWNGAATYRDLLVHMSFTFVGVGLGTIVMTRDVIYANSGAPEGIGGVTRKWLVVAMVGFLVTQALALAIDSRYCDQSE